MTKEQKDSYLVKLQDERTVWVGEEKVDILSYLTSSYDEIHSISDFFDEQWNINSFPFNRQESFHYSPFSVPQTILELEEQKYHLSYQFPEGSFFSEGWTDIAHSFLQGWFFSENHLQSNLTEFSASIDLLIQRLKQQKRLITMPYILLGAPHSIQRSSLNVVRRTEDGIYINGTQKFPSDSLVVHELLTLASYQDKEILFTVPVNNAGVSLHVQEGGSDFGVIAHFKDVHIPWDRVLVQNKLENIAQLFYPEFVTTYPDYQRVSSLLNQLQWLTDLALYAAKEIGNSEKLHIQEALGELLQQLDIIKAYLHLSEIKAENRKGGIVPNRHALQTAKSQGIFFYKRAIDILQRVSGDLYLQDFYGYEDHSESKILYSFISRYTATSAASHRQQYQSFYTGDPEYVWAEYYQSYPTDFFKERLKSFWDFHHSENLFTALTK